MKRLLVIGGGLAGLSAAWHAQRHGATIRVLENSPVVGGVLQTIREGGYLVETGANSLMLSTSASVQLLRDLGLDSQIVEPASAARRRYVVRRGRLVAMPLSPWQLLTSPLLSASAKIRLLGEPWSPRRDPSLKDEESLAEFTRRRLGEEPLTYAVEPFAAGVFAGDPEKLSLRHAFPRLKGIVEQHGSLLMAALQLSRRRSPAGAASGPRPISFRDGLANLPNAFATQIGISNITLNARLLSLEQSAGSTWRASWQAASGVDSAEFDALVLAVPAPAFSGLPLPSTIAASLAPTQKLEHPPVTVVALGYARDAVHHPLDGFGVLVPAVENFSVLGTLFTSSLFPHRAPAGHVLLTTFAGGTRQPQFAVLPDDQLVALVARDLKKLLGAQGRPVFQKIIRWPRAIPQYNLDYATHLAALESAEAACPTLALAGSYRGGVSVTQVIESGRAAAIRSLNLSPSAAA